MQTAQTAVTRCDRSPAIAPRPELTIALPMSREATFVSESVGPSKLGPFYALCDEAASQAEIMAGFVALFDPFQGPSVALGDVQTTIAMLGDDAA